ncbi:hypothetical protein C8R48DRAFT_810430 [Suillus tomentosus]|nr:hypothetical protein C8R48DRAFT_810430 [Suillus tomentosus]
MTQNRSSCRISAHTEHSTSFAKMISESHAQHSPSGYRSFSRTECLAVVLLCDVSYEKQVEIDDWTHQNGVHFISAETRTRGLFGHVMATTPFLISSVTVFNDFGPKLPCVDPTGKQALTGMIVSVQNKWQDKEGLVTCLDDESRHGLEDGVTFTEVQGMT